METVIEETCKAYEIVRTLEDGQTVRVGTFRELDKARGLVASLSEYWPGAYSILPSSEKHNNG